VHECSRVFIVLLVAAETDCTQFGDRCRVETSVPKGFYGVFTWLNAVKHSSYEEQGALRLLKPSLIAPTGISSDAISLLLWWANKAMDCGNDIPMKREHLHSKSLLKVIKHGSVALKSIDVANFN